MSLEVIMIKKLIFALFALYTFQPIFGMNIAALGQVPANNEERQELNALLLATDNFEELKRLLTAGAHVNTQDADGWTALTNAANKSNAENILLLLDAGADVNIPTKNNDTALNWTLYRFNEDICKILLDSGAAINIPNLEGDTPLKWAASMGATQEHICKTLITRPLFNPCIPKLERQASQKRIFLILLVFKRACPKLSKDMRHKFLWDYYPKDVRNCAFNIHKNQHTKTPFLPIPIICTLLQHNLLNAELTVDAIKTHHCEFLKPIMADAIPAPNDGERIDIFSAERGGRFLGTQPAPSNEQLRALLNPNNLEANLGGEIEKIIRDRLGLIETQVRDDAPIADKDELPKRKREREELEEDNG